jgi:hypothetical protein
MKSIHWRIACVILSVGTAQAQDGEGAPVEAAPVEAAPVEAAPVEAAPVEAAPVEAGPVEAPVAAIQTTLKGTFKAMDGEGQADEGGKTRSKAILQLGGPVKLAGKLAVVPSEGGGASAKLMAGKMIQRDVCTVSTSDTTDQEATCAGIKLGAGDGSLVIECTATAVCTYDFVVETP